MPTRASIFTYASCPEPAAAGRGKILRGTFDASRNDSSCVGPLKTLSAVLAFTPTTSTRAHTNAASDARPPFNTNVRR